jgi:DNA-directed RNA polymerase specialized sigma24 family protein
MDNTSNKPSKRLDDEAQAIQQLVNDAAAGNSEALLKLLAQPKVQSRALAICQRIIRRSPRSGYYRDAEDLRQELFILFWLKFDKFRGGNDEAAFWSFFEKLGRNIHLHQARQSMREIQQTEEKSLDESTVASQEDQDSLLAIKEIVSSLSEGERWILEQRVAGKNLVEIANEAPFEITKPTLLRKLVNINQKLIAALTGRNYQNTAKKGRTKKTVSQTHKSKGEIKHHEEKGVDALLIASQEERFLSLDQARERFAALIDKKFSASLSLDEQAELIRLEEIIDRAEAPLYNETIRRLKEIRDRLSFDPSR